MGTNLILLVFAIFILGCIQKPDLKINIKDIQKESQTIEYGDSLSQYLSEWKKDSSGCLNLRTKEKAEIIIQFLRKRPLSKQIIYQNLGNPNEEKRHKENLILIYYFGSICINGSIVKNSDKCYAKFYMKDDSLKEMDFTCE